MSVHPIVIGGASDSKMPRQIADLSRHYPVANYVHNEAVLLTAHGGRDHCLLSGTDLAPRDKLGAADMACPAIFIHLRPDDIDLCSHQMLSKERTINDWTQDHGNTSLGGSPDNIVLLGVHHVCRPGSGGRSTP